MATKFVSAFAERDILEQSIDVVCKDVKQQIDGQINFCLFFASGYASAACHDMFGSVANKLGTENIIGCNAEAIVFDSLEVEGKKCISMLAASIDDALVDCFQLEFSKTPDGMAMVGWPESDWPDGSTLFVLADPMSFPADVLLSHLKEDRPEVNVFGGMCSGAFANESFLGDPRQQSLSVLCCGAETSKTGAAVLRIAGGVNIQPIVSQGCRPIGEPLIVTRCERNEITELGGTPAVERLLKIFNELPARDQQIFQSGLHLGLAMTEYKEKFGYGDFLIRNISSIEQESNSIVADAYFRKGQTVQFHLRDEQSADADLSVHLNDIRKKTENALAAVAFLCNGRGINMFPEPHHDMALLQERLGPIPACGAFAAGELGPVMGENHVHGFTFVGALFC